jgi:hypothetical protein
MMTRSSAATAKSAVEEAVFQETTAKKLFENSLEKKQSPMLRQNESRRFLRITKKKGNHESHE